MSSKEKIKVAGIKLRTDKPTNVAMDQLFGWVIWQFPQPQRRGYQGAVRPPEPEHAWIPAVIEIDNNRVRVYGNAGEMYPTPEKAVEFFNNEENKY
ncbi:MAG: hypothetical protein ACK2T4_00355 [Candidatus Promineifilaceae bacterium]|jgi:hypothetical protein